MAIIKLDGGYNALPISYKRGNPIPLDTTAVWYDEAQLRTYAKDGATAYIGQILTLVKPILDEEGTDTGLKTSVVYVIANAEGDLIKLADANTDADELAERVAELEQVWGADPDNLKKTLDSIKEIQDFISSDDGQDSFLTLAEQVNQIYKETWGEDGEGNPVLVSTGGILVDEVNKTRTAIEHIYKPIFEKDEDGKLVLGEDGKPIITGEEGLLVDTKETIDETIAALFTPTAFELDENNEIKIDANGNRLVLEAKGEIVNWLPIATAERLGRVKSSNKENYVKVHDDGTMEVNSLNVMKLVQTEGDLLILDGGNANGITPNS